ncbi:RecB family exonuclease [Paenibacillus endophyticus]|uniref:RecB family exonuclease n=1 Tax=Paenibacillus endophyticus TaxID=1294268 RepID=A0A7W5CDZ0_9BACL|nr:PD-(D/E)XK nuclease family protein [Paenibacillus endophyticus]MBB3155459.1 RecB family exonuclease [Paenibacillus endophyticus]
MDLIDQLYRKINEERLTPKVLLVSSYAQGHQLLELICNRHGALFNVEVKTIRGIIEAKAKLELFQRKIHLLDEGQAVWIIRLLMKQLAEETSECYITHSMMKPGIVEKVYHAISEMRMAGICSEDMKMDYFTNPDKGMYLQQLLNRYETYLLEHGQIDFGGLSEYLKHGTDGAIYLALSPTGWTRVEHQMMEKLAGKCLCFLDSETPFHISEGFSKNRFTMFHATGSLAEVREGIRRILSEPEALDHTEIILSDYERYISVIHAHAEEMGAACSYSNGLPIAFCAAGKAAAGILDWIEDGYPVKRISEMLRHGYMSFSDERWSRGEWVRILERSSIGWGRERYLALVHPEEIGAEDQEQSTVLYGYLATLFEGLPEGDDWDVLRLLEWVSEFIKQYAPRRSQDDVYVGNTLQELVIRFSESPRECMPMDLALKYVREMLSGIRIRVSATPKPGAVHVSSLHNGGWSGRERTWIAGLDQGTWSVSAKQEPLLLDKERKVLSEHLVSTQQRAQKIRNERESRLSLIRGEVWLSYSSYDAGDKKSQSPAFEMLQVFRLQSGDSSLDFATLEHSLGEPYSVMDMMHESEVSTPFNNTDLWAGLLLRRTFGKSADGWQAMLQTYPSLAQGYRAKELRMDEKVSAYDGFLGDQSSYPKQLEDSSWSAISASQLEKYANCGLQYYFHYVLKLRAKNVAALDRTRWLQAGERGTLLHDIFRRYIEDVTECGKVSAKHDRDRLMAIVDMVIRETTLSIPAPNRHVLAKECEEIQRDADIFFRNEAGKTDQPCFFELELSTSDGEPMEIELPGGIRIQLKGFVDRVDRIGPHEYRIIDYKTGSTNKYKPSEYFSGGTQLQHALYSVAVEQWLRQTGIDPEAKVLEAEYYFPTERGRGEYVRRTQNRREELSAIVSQLLESQNRGIFVPAKNANTCRWCDYQAVCGSHSEWMAGKRDSSINMDLLRTLLEVERFG